MKNQNDNFFFGTEKDEMNIDEYVERINNISKYYFSRCEKYKKRFYICCFTRIIASALIPIISLGSEISASTITVSVLAGIITVSESYVNVTQAYKELIEKIGLPYICPHDLRHTYTTLLMKNNINQRAIAASLGHTQFETYTDEHRKEYVIADNSLNEDIYERGIETNVGDLMYGATKEAKGLLDLAEAEETFAQAGEKCVQNAIITTVQYIYKFGCEVGIY